MKMRIAADDSVHLRQQKQKQKQKGKENLLSNATPTRRFQFRFQYRLRDDTDKAALDAAAFLLAGIGFRRDMEDAVKIELEFTRKASELACSHEYDFFAVYDGHGGSRVADKCRQRMHLIVAEEVARRWPIIESEFGCWVDTMMESFRRLDAEVEANKEQTMYDGVEPGFWETVGSTALVAVVGEKIIVVANCGVSRAVLSRGGNAVTLSSDHKPNRLDEMQRIEAAGGKVIESDCYRVWGILTTSRSIGDHKLKPYVICEPEVTIMERVEEDEFLILASDGLWDVISNEMACRIVRSCLFTDPAPIDAASLLAKTALSRGSRDNISVIVVQLSNPNAELGSAKA